MKKSFFIPSQHNYTLIPGWLKELVMTVLTAIGVHWLFLQPYLIPSGSMNPNFLEGDYVLVSKVHYGTKTTSTPLKVPFTEKDLWFGIPYYSDRIRLPTYRLPGISQVKVGDCLVFNFPGENAQERNKPLSVKENYIKRCIGCPGDVVEIKEGVIQVNGEETPEHYNRQYLYKLAFKKTTKGRVTSHFFKAYGITKWVPIIGGGYHVYITKAIARQLKKSAIVKEVRRSLGDKSQEEMAAIKVPHQGMEITVNKQTCQTYGYLIQYYEGHKQVKLNKDKLFIDGDEVQKYTFKQNYFAVFGDNHNNSKDMRVWGLLPESHLVGKPVMIVFSLKDPKQWPLIALLSFRLKPGRFFLRV